jgi:medium-chain acyl-[acyl-carrier-protein] hydrolase
MYSTPWLIRQPGDPRRLRLYCFAYAGGSAARFVSWQADLDPAIEVCAVQLPGRGSRFNEVPYTSMTALIEALGSVIAGQEDRQQHFAFFGHSLGGLLAFELARYCQQHHLPLPTHLFVSGCAAPQHRLPAKGVHKLPDDELIDALKDYNGTPREILENSELMAMMLHVIRADFTLVENYTYRPGSPLSIPMTVLAGKRDSHVSTDQVQGWQKETTSICSIRWFDGDHFFINAERDAVLDCVKTQLAGLQPA